MWNIDKGWPILFIPMRKISVISFKYPKGKDSWISMLHKEDKIVQLINLQDA